MKNLSLPLCLAVLLSGLLSGPAHATSIEAKYITQTANGLLKNEQSLGALTTGLTLNTVTGSTGVLSAYAGTTCTSQVVRVLSASGAATCVTLTSAYVDATIVTTGVTLTSDKLVVGAGLGALKLFDNSACDNLVLTWISGVLSCGSVDISTVTVTKTNMTLNAESTGNLITLPRRLYFPAAGCNNATAGPIWSLPASNAPAVACDTGTNTQAGTLAFDASTDESAQVDYLLPTTWTGAIDARILWKAAATSGATGWCVQLISVADAETSDPAYPAQGAGNCVSDTAKGTTLQENIAPITGVTATGVAAGERLFIKVSRDANGGAVTDDMTGDALLIGIELTIREAM